jgi:hypothetical protein
LPEYERSVDSCDPLWWLAGRRAGAVRNHE